jgi:endonuclease-8
MPEGPETKRQADEIHRALAGEVARSVWFAFPELGAAPERLEGRRIDQVRPRGKALLIGFEGGLFVYTHNQLYGRWFVRKSGQPPKTRRSLRLRIATDRATAFLYSASTIELLDGAQLGDHPFLGRLGPDVLAPETTVEELRSRLRDARFRRRGLAALLLDQRFLAGLGNYLRSEILFHASVKPTDRPVDLESGQLRKLADSIATLAERAYTGRGVTNDPRVVRRAKRAGRRRRDYRHYVFARAGQPCPRCGATIEKTELAGRRLYWCRGCQG